MIQKVVPFFSNTKDDTHCVQATLRMILKYFIPGKNFSWKKLDKISKKERGKGTWFHPALIWFADNGFKVIDIELFDYKKFCSEREKYVYKSFSKIVAEYYLKESNLMKVKKYIPEFLKKVNVEKRSPTIKEIEKLLDLDYLVTVDLNANVLDNEKGYNGHAVLIIGHNKDTLLLHDPGLPPHKNRIVTKKLFNKAWSKKYGS